MFLSTTELRRRLAAPFDVFLSADSFYPDDLVKSGNADLSTRLTFAYGKIAVWNKHPERFETLMALLTLALRIEEISDYDNFGLMFDENW
jgi:ABC-type molybdate transport system substrate-binding protein